jgi:hypothetical protein
MLWVMNSGSFYLVMIENWKRSFSKLPIIGATLRASGMMVQGEANINFNCLAGCFELTMRGAFYHQYLVFW